MIIINGFQPLTFVTKSFILEVKWFLPGSKCILKVNNINIRKRYEICSKLNFEHISHLAKVLLLLL